MYLSYLAAAGEAPNPIIPIWQEVVVGAVGFALLCFILMKYVFPRMEQTFRARVDAIEGGIKRAEQAQAEANTLLEQYRQQLAEARSEAARIRDEARADAAGIRDEILASAREESERIIAAGRESLAAERSTWRAASSASRWPTRPVGTARSSASCRSSARAPHRPGLEGGADAARGHPRVDRCGQAAARRARRQR
jgi:F-type H+-transporting ATPase subunit b